MKFLTAIIFCFCINIALSQPQRNPGFYTEVYDTSYNFNNLGFSYTTRSVARLVGLPQIHYATYGMRWMDNGNPIFRGRFVPTDTLGQFESIYQAFQTFRDGSYAIWRVEGSNIGYFLIDSSLSEIINLYDINVFPDVHGIAKLDDNRIAYFDNSVESINFYNPPSILDSTTYLALGHNINLLDLNDSSKTVLFNWHNTVSKTMVIPEYFYEGDQDTNFIDWGHPNWIHQDFDGHIIVSWRHLGISKISIDNGEVIWWAGLPEGLAAANGFSTLRCIMGDCRTRLQHHFKPIPSGAAEYILFDNGDLERDSSRALLLEIDEQDSTIKVTKEYWFETSDFMGSVDILPNGNLLVNVPTFGESISIGNVTSWIIQGVVQDSIGPYLKDMGSRIYFLEPSGNILGKYSTDSLNFVYSSQIRNFDFWPSVTCDNDSVRIDKIVDNLVWSNGIQADAILADGNIVNASFDFGITTGLTRFFNTNNCLTTSLSDIIKNDVTIYPNPSHDYIRIVGYQGSIKIIDSKGQVVFDSNSSNGIIPIDKLSNGWYNVVGDSFSRSILKQ